jgi:hypothetical protein
MARPDQLVKREGSLFKSLIDATGSSSSQHLMHYILEGKQQGKTISNLMQRGRDTSNTLQAAKSVREVRKDITPAATANTTSNTITVPASSSAVNAATGEADKRDKVTVAVAVIDADPQTPRPNKFFYLDDFDEDSFEDFMDFVVAKPAPGRTFKNV